MGVELYFTVMAGMVLAFFLMVGEVVALRKTGMKLYSRLKAMRSEGRKARYYAEITLALLFFLIQPFIVAWLVTGALNGFNPHFAVNLARELTSILGR